MCHRTSSQKSIGTGFYEEESRDYFADIEISVVLVSVRSSIAASRVLQSGLPRAISIFYDISIYNQRSS